MPDLSLLGSELSVIPGMRVDIFQNLYSIHLCTE